MSQQPDLPDDVIEMPDVPLPQSGGDIGVVDEFPRPAAFNFAFIGSGQGGCRIAEGFWKLGYRRVCCINTALQDLGGLDLPEANKRNIATHGAGKDPALAARAIAEHREDIYDVMARVFGPSFDRIFVTIGAGGGTGTGTAEPLVVLSHEILQSLKLEPDPVGKPRVGVICTLPMRSESRHVNANAYHLVKRLIEMSVSDDPSLKISPLIFVDNERIKTIYPKVPVDAFWPSANRSITTLFHVFNVLAQQPTRYTVFDRMDFDHVLNSGLVVFGATPLTKWSDQTDISYAIRDNVRRNVLVDGVDLRTGIRAACVIMGARDVLNEVPQQYLEHGFEQLTRMMRPTSTVHRGIYCGVRSGLTVYTMIGGLDAPVERFDELARLGGVHVQDHDGV